MSTRRRFLRQAAACSAIPMVRAADPVYVTADTSFGKIRGIDNEGVKTFKGIPYGANTAASNRFRPPVDPAKWGGVRDTLNWGPSAPQTEPGARRGGGDLTVAAAGLPPEGEE